jgi:hypothetical protein
MDTLVLENKLELSVVEVKVVEVTLKPWVVVVDGISSTSIVRPKVAQLLQ